MRKVCPKCDGRGIVMVNINGYPLDGIVCLECDKTGYIDVPEDSNEVAEETANTVNL